MNPVPVPPVPFITFFNGIDVAVAIWFFCWSLIKLFLSLAPILGIVLLHCFMIGIVGLLENGQPAISILITRQLDALISEWITWTGIGKFN